MAERVDLLVVGAGPAGSSTALHLVRRDLRWASRLLVVDRARHPRPKLCGGAITHFGYQVLERLGLPEPAHFPVREARLVYRGRSIPFRGEPMLRVTRRDQLDHWLLSEVEESGVRVWQGVTVQDLRVHDDRVEVATERGSIDAGVVVAADGSLSLVRRALGWHSHAPLARLLEVLTPADPDRDPEHRDHLATFDLGYTTSHALQGYYWEIPTMLGGRPFVSRGVLDSRVWPTRPRARLTTVLGEALSRRGLEIQQQRLHSHPIRWWNGRDRLAIPRVLLVGDAAGTDPLFGEGISFSLAYGEVAAEAIADAFDRDDFTLADYRQRVVEHGLLRQLPIRTGMARIAYRVTSPAVFGLLWRLTAAVVARKHLARRTWRLIATLNRALTRSR